MQTSKPILAITMGDPAGIGPEIAVKALASESIHKLCRPLLVGDADVIEQAATLLGRSLRLNRITRPSEGKFHAGIIDIIDLDNADIRSLNLGRVSKVAGQAAFESLTKAIELALAGEVAGIVTNPIHKEAINLAGHRFAGHTEILAHYTGAKNVAMLLVHGPLRVVHVSTHVPLRQACDLVKKDRILKVTELLADACRHFGVQSPRLGVAGLNPHAGDGGLFGAEETTEISPAVAEAQTLGIDVEGPIPPDTLFAKAKAGIYDGVVAMYHDQGHIPFKLETFTFTQKRVQAIHGVNITLGLPIIRTSVDHGTAFDIAGKGLANPDTLLEAVEYAARLASPAKP